MLVLERGKGESLPTSWVRSTVWMIKRLSRFCQTLLITSLAARFIDDKLGRDMLISFEVPEPSMTNRRNPGAFMLF